MPDATFTVTRPSSGAGEPAAEDGRVTVKVASGKVRFSADSVMGSTYAEAAARLEKLGLVVKRRTVPRTGGVGTVVALSQSGRVTDGSTVTLAVAVTPAPTSVATAPTTSGGPSTTGPGRGKGKDKPPGKTKK
ncbi:MAG: PASTA domain-containing protein [Actinomycetales bacterium]|nr:MAG: PASTA domain-containing protein [Actinomycetales bacterium]